MWGSPPIQVPEDAVICWGARAIHEPRGFGFQLLGDRMSWGPAGFDRAMAEWLDKRALPAAKKWAKTQDGRSSEIFSLDSEDGLFRFRATPNASYGYVYMAAWVRTDTQNVPS